MKNKLKIWIACSGGIDSVVLAHFLHTHNFNIGVLHCNFHLRGAESDADEEFVKQFCKGLNIPCEVKHFDTTKEVLKRKGNTQVVARDLRYEWFNKKLSENNCVVALGHHQNDQIETFLIQLERGGGIKGLCAMTKERNKFIRPLLNKSKSWILAYANTHSLQWREDSSNQSTKYKRNLYRNKLLQLLNLNSANILGLVQNFQDLNHNLQEHIAGLNFTEIKVQEWLKFPILVKTEILHSYSIANTQIIEIDKLCNSLKGTKLTFKEYSIYKNENSLAFKSNAKTKYSLLLTEVNTATFSDSAFYVDALKIKGEVSIRTWQTGDRFQPLGLKGSKRVSKYLKDLKLNSATKANNQVIIDQEKIIAVQFGVPSESVKIDKYTKKILKLEILED